MRSQEKVCATLFGVWMRTLDEPFIGGEGEAGGGEERPAGRTLCSLGSVLRKGRKKQGERDCL